MKSKSFFHSFIHAPCISPSGFFIRGIFLASVFIILHLTGLKEYTTVISGSTPGGVPLNLTIMAIGILYTGSYFCFVFIAPVLIIASVIFYFLNRLFPDQNSRVAASNFSGEDSDKQ